MEPAPFSIDSVSSPSAPRLIARPLGWQSDSGKDEEIEPRTFTIDEARALVQSGEIVDLKTLAGLSLI